MSQHLINFILDASYKISGLLFRDYSEIEKLSMNPRTIAFVDKSLERTYNMLKNTLSQYSDDTQVVLSHQFIEIDKLAKKPEILFVITPVDAVANFTKSLNFFAMTIIAMELDDNNSYKTSAALINFPSLKQSCYAYDGGGLWFKDFGFDNKHTRLKIHNRQMLQNCMIVSDRAQNFAAKLTINNIAINKLTFRNFGSIAFASMLFFTNKADCVLYTNIDKANLEAIKLFTQESGAVFTQVKETARQYSLISNFASNLIASSLN